MGTTVNYSLRYPAETDSPDGATQIQNLAEDVDGAIAGAVATQFVLPLFARKATQEARASTTTVADDTSLKVTGLLSGATYEVRGIISYDGGTGGSFGGLKWTFSTPTSSSGFYTVLKQNDSHTLAGAFPSNWGDTNTADSTGVGTAMSLTLEGLLIPGANGTLTFRWAQETSSVTNTHINANSYLVVRRAA